MAGARAVGIGSAVAYRGIGVFGEVKREIEGFMREEGYRDLEEIIGAAHG